MANNAILSYKQIVIILTKKGKLNNYKKPGCKNLGVIYIGTRAKSVVQLRTANGYQIKFAYYTQHLLCQVHTKHSTSIFSYIVPQK